MTTAQHLLFLSLRPSWIGDEDWIEEKDLARRENQLIESCPSQHILITLLDMGERSFVLAVESTIKWIDKGVFQYCNDFHSCYLKLLTQFLIGISKCIF